MSEASSAGASIDPELRSASILFGYTWRAIFTPIVLGIESREETEIGIALANSETHWDNGKKITHGDRQNLAAMDCLQDLVEATTPSASDQFVRRVNGGEAIYAATESRLAEVGLPPRTKYNRSTFELTKLALNDYSVEVPADIAVARGVWRSHGTVTEERATKEDYFSAIRAEEVAKTTRPDTEIIAPDVILVDNDGTITPGYALPIPHEVAVEVPFYDRHYSERSGAAETLHAYLADLLVIYEGLRGQ